MSRYGVLVFSLASYAVGFGGLTYFMLFVGGWSFLPWHVDAHPGGDPAAAILINLGLIALFGVQHSVMARPWFKRQAARVLPRAAERSLYVLASGVALMAICCGWRRAPAGVAWRFDHEAVRAALTALYAGGWTLAVASSFAIDHWELFGMRQALRHFAGDAEPGPAFIERGFYRFVRHPLQCGVLIGLWATPTMTASHFLLSMAMTAYIFVGLALEERGLAAELGHTYEDYRRRVPMLVPRLPRRERAATA